MLIHKLVSPTMSPNHTCLCLSCVFTEAGKELKHTWTILYKKENTSETLAFFLDVATTDVLCVKELNGAKSLKSKLVTKSE